MLPAIVLALVHVLCDAFASTRTTLEWLLCVFLGSNYVMSPAMTESCFRVDYATLDWCHRTHHHRHFPRVWL